MTTFSERTTLEKHFACAYIWKIKNSFVCVFTDHGFCLYKVSSRSFLILVLDSVAFQLVYIFFLFLFALLAPSYCCDFIQCLRSSFFVYFHQTMYYMNFCVCIALVNVWFVLFLSRLLDLPYFLWYFIFLAAILKPMVLNPLSTLGVCVSLWKTGKRLLCALCVW